VKQLLEAAKKVVAQPGYFLECPGDDDGQPCQYCRERAELVEAINHAAKRHEGRGA
jgi:hypothetical protein